MYMLAKVRDNGEELFQGYFDTVEDIQKALAPRVGLKLDGTRLVLEAPDLSKYRVRTIQKNVIVSGPGFGEIDLADHYVTIRSRDSGELYTVAISEGKLVACSCPSFQYAKDKDTCKHLALLEVNPYPDGIVCRGGRYAPLYKQPEGPSIDLFYSPLRGSYVGNPGSWRS